MKAADGWSSFIQSGWFLAFNFPVIFLSRHLPPPQSKNLEAECFYIEGLANIAGSQTARSDGLPQPSEKFNYNSININDLNSKFLPGSGSPRSWTRQRWIMSTPYARHHISMYWALNTSAEDRYSAQAMRPNSGKSYLSGNFSMYLT